MFTLTNPKTGQTFEIDEDTIISCTWVDEITGEETVEAITDHEGSGLPIDLIGAIQVGIGW